MALPLFTPTNHHQNPPGLQPLTPLVLPSITFSSKSINYLMMQNITSMFPPAPRNNYLIFQFRIEVTSINMFSLHLPSIKFSTKAPQQLFNCSTQHTGYLNASPLPALHAFPSIAFPTEPSQHLFNFSI